MRTLNKVTLIGNLGKDPEFQLLEGNLPIAKFSLATSESFKDKDGNLQTQAEWHNIIVWRALAEVVRNCLHKGNLVYIEGKIKTRTYNDKEGNKKYVTEIIGDMMLMLDKKQKANANPDH